MKFWDLIKASVYNKIGKPSSARIASYFILIAIIVHSITYVIIEFINASKKWSIGETYEVPWAHITIFTLILSHHLILLGLKKASDKDENVSNIVAGSNNALAIKNGKKESSVTPDNPDKSNVEDVSDEESPD